MCTAGLARGYAIFLALVVTLASEAQTHSAPADIDEVRRRNPDALVPGTVTPLLDSDPPGYLICTLVTRYFDDETITDLQGELQLSARLQFVRFMSMGRSGYAGRTQVTVRGFQHIAIWWEGSALLGLFFAAADGLLRDGEPSDDFGPAKSTALEQPKRPTAAELLLDARGLRKRHEIHSAREVLGRLRHEYPMSPEARRALRELYFVNTAESRVRSSGRERP
jgi:hypothetical protein